MKTIFSRNIDTKGRIVRGLGVCGLLAGSAFGFSVSAWLGAGLLAAGLFVACEAPRLVLLACLWDQDPFVGLKRK